MSECVPLSEQIAVVESWLSDTQARLYERSRYKTLDELEPELRLNEAIKQVLSTLRYVEANRDTIRAFVIAQRQSPRGRP